MIALKKASSTGVSVVLFRGWVGKKKSSGISQLNENYYVRLLLMAACFSTICGLVLLSLKAAAIDSFASKHCGNYAWNNSFNSFIQCFNRDWGGWRWKLHYSVGTRISAALMWFVCYQHQRSAFLLNAYSAWSSLIKRFVSPCCLFCLLAAESKRNRVPQVIAVSWK